jgi:hypothetical protein
MERPLSNAQLGGNAKLALRGDALPQVLAYRPTTISTPAAMARIAITVPNPEKLRWSSGTSPVKISQMANSNIPTLLVSFITRLPYGDA